MGQIIEEYYPNPQGNGSSLRNSSNERILRNVFSFSEKPKVSRVDRRLVIQHTLDTDSLRIEGQERHMDYVEGYSIAIGKILFITGDQLRDLALAAKLHDVGKAFLKPGILDMPRKLSDKEMEEIKKHPEIGYWLLKSDSRYQKVAEYVRHHHERWDGLGYPGGLKGGEIPLFSRIIAVADAYDAMTSKRVYQKTKSCPEAVRELIKHSGSQFDPNIVKIFVEKVLWIKP